jgi:hypothetical protein
MLTLVDNVILFAILYTLHASFRKVDLTGFIVTFAIAVMTNYYLINYLHIPFTIGLLMVIILFPIFQILFKMATKSSTPQPLTHHFIPAPKPRLELVNQYNYSNVPEVNPFQHLPPEMNTMVEGLPDGLL